jgi:hypothetical protein
MRRRNALVIGTALAGLGYSLVRHYNVPADAPEPGTQPVPLQVVEPVREEKPVKAPRDRPDTTEAPRARTTRAPRTSATRARPARPKKAKVPVESA